MNRFFIDRFLAEKTMHGRRFFSFYLLRYWAWKEGNTVGCIISYE